MSGLSPERTPEASSTVSWLTIADARATVPRHVVHRRFASETVLLNVQTGHYYGLDSIGARFFEVLRESATIRSAVISLTEEFEGSLEDIQNDMLKFFEDLRSRGLIDLMPRS